jgi:hypothetical protein
MRVDRYSKIVLTVIALLLAFVAFKLGRRAPNPPLPTTVVGGRNRPQTYAKETVEPGTYAFQSGIPYGQPGMCWDLRSQDFGSGAVRIQQNACNGTNYQNFIVTDPDSDGFYRIETQFSDYHYVVQAGIIGFGLTADLGSSFGPGLLPESFNRWRFNDQPGGAGRRFIVNKYDGTCVDRPTEAMNEGDRIQTYTCNGSEGQTWIPLGAK